MTSEKREGLRESAKTVIVRFFDESEHRGSQRLHKGLVENCSVGGMYISTENPSPRGKVISLTFQAGSEKSQARLPSEVRATVRWVRRVTSPKGMGVEFLECNGMTEREFKERLTALAG